MEYKQAIIVRQDLKLSPGKLAAQVAHAAVESYLRADKEAGKNWRNEGMKKVVLKAKNLEELHQLKEGAKSRNISTALITDAGLTEIPPGTVTCLGIGPEKEENINKVTGNLSKL